MTEKDKTVFPKIIIPESTLGGNYTSNMDIPIGYHKAQITDVALVSPDDQFNNFHNYQYRLVLTFPQFSEDDKLPPGLFYNITVMSHSKDKDGNDIEGDYRCAIFPGGTSKAVKAFEAVGIEITPGLEITPELLLNKFVAVSVSPHTTKTGNKVKIAKEILPLSEIEDELPSTPKVKSKSKASATKAGEDIYDDLLKGRFKGVKKDLEDEINKRMKKFNDLVPREGILAMIQNDA